MTLYISNRRKMGMHRLRSSLVTFSSCAFVKISKKFEQFVGKCWAIGVKVKVK
jgi:hypothetical protein